MKKWWPGAEKKDFFGTFVMVTQGHTFVLAFNNLWDIKIKVSRLRKGMF